MIVHEENDLQMMGFHGFSTSMLVYQKVSHLLIYDCHGSPLSGALSGAMLQQSAQNPTAETVAREPGGNAGRHFNRTK